MKTPSINFPKKRVTGIVSSCLNTGWSKYMANRPRKVGSHLALINQYMVTVPNLFLPGYKYAFRRNDLKTNGLEIQTHPPKKRVIHPFFGGSQLIRRVILHSGWCVFCFSFLLIGPDSKRNLGIPSSPTGTKNPSKIQIRIF